MRTWTVSDWVILLGAIGTVSVSLVNAVGSYWGRKDARVAVTVANEAVSVAKDLAATAVTVAAETKTAIVEAVSSTAASLAHSDSKLDRIGVQTNGSLSALQNKYEIALERIARCEGIISHQAQVVVAQSAVIADHDQRRRSTDVK